MSGRLTKRPRIRLDPEGYRILRQQVLERDGWRCQACGALENLQVHHIKFRSRTGEDTEENLIALCFSCHSAQHCLSR